MTLMTSIQAFTGALTDLQALLSSLKKYESAFTAEAKQLFQSTSFAGDQAAKELEHLPAASEGSLAGYIAIGDKTMRLRTALQHVQQAMSGFTSGSIPVPRSSKEELSRVHGLLLSVKLALSSEQQLLITQLRKLSAEVDSRKQDFDVIETNLDNTMRNVLQQVHGKSELEPEALATELKALQAGILDARAKNASQLDDVLSLALNSIQRMHAGQAESDDDEDDAVSTAAAVGGVDEEDDDDDPFFMPMPGAIKWAEASMFKELAKPLAPEQPADKQFMIVMEDDDVSQTPSSMAGVSAEPSANTLVGTVPAGSQQQPLDEDDDPSPAAPAAAAAVAAAATTAAVATAAALGQFASGSAAEAETAAIADAADEGSLSGSGEEALGTLEAVGTAPARAALSDDDLADTSDADVSTANDAAAQSPPQAPGDHVKAGPTPLVVPSDEKAVNSIVKAAPGAAAVAAAAATAESPTPEKLTDFVNFLNGENPGACMFHAQMRLSPEGCMKLANFLRSSARVRALSLSHNYLGDAGLRLICDGLRENKSVTALDLPDNNITDIGAAILAESIKDNPSLTQLQLAYNKIGDQGAMALAQVIRTSHSLKKLGLAFNNIGKAGCQALTAAISSNQSLKHMQLLPGNPVEEKDAKALAKALKRNNKFSIKQLLGLKNDS